MKKLSILLASAVTVLAMSSCTGDEAQNPKYETVIGYMELNTPPMATQYYTLVEGGTIDLTWSQPDWGYAAASEYVVEASYKEDFAYFDNDTQSYIFELPSKYNKCQAAVPMEELATAMSKLSPVQDEEKFNALPAQKVYLRVKGRIPTVEGSTVYSNPICLEQVKAYWAVQLPGKIYLVGSPEGWKGPDAGNAEHYAPWALSEKEDAIGSNVFYGSFNLCATPMFRFYSALTGWDKDSWGSQEADSPLDFTITGSSFRGAIDGPGWKGAYNFPAFSGGDVDIVVDLGAKYWTMDVK